MEYVYRTQGTCSTNIELNVEDGVVKEVAFWGGCNGNLQGISRLVRGMKVADVIAKLEGVHCGGRPTSCPDQLCRAEGSSPWSAHLSPPSGPFLLIGPCLAC